MWGEGSQDGLEGSTQQEASSGRAGAARRTRQQGQRHRRRTNLPRHGRSGVRVGHDRFGVVVGEWVIQPGVSNTPGRPCRDADGNDRAQGTGEVDPVLDAGREGPHPEEPARSYRGKAAGWTPGTAIRQNGPTSACTRTGVPLALHPPPVMLSERST